MALTQGCLNVQFFTQRIIQPPIKLLENNTGIILIQSPEHFVKKSICGVKFPPVSKLLWDGFKHSMTFYVICSLVRLFWLITNWKLIGNFEELGYYTLALPINFIGRTAYYTVDTHSNDCRFVVSQRFKMVPIFRYGMCINIIKMINDPYL